MFICETYYILTKLLIVLFHSLIPLVSIKTAFFEKRMMIYDHFMIFSWQSKSHVFP